MKWEDLLELENLSIHVGLGHAKYKMNRGTFTTKDSVPSIKKLSFFAKNNDQYIYKYQDIELIIQPIITERDLKLEFYTESSINRMWISFKSDLSEHFYGCGEQFTHFNLKHKKVKIWVSEHHSVKKIVKKFLFEKIFGKKPNHISKEKNHQTYYAQPSFLSSKRYFIHVDVHAYSVFHFKKNHTMLYFREIPKSLTILTDDNFLGLASKVSNLLGIQKPMPKWTENGAIIAIQGGLSTIHQKIDLALKSGIKVVGVWSQDWSGELITSFGKQVYWNWQYDERLYPNLKEEIALLRKQNIHFTGYINTFLKEDTALYQEAEKKNFFVQTLKGDTYKIKSTTFDAGIIDLTNPNAYTWYKEIIKKNMIDLGMSGWMADFGEYLPIDSKIYAGNPELLHNEWPTLWAKLNMEAINESMKSDELFFFTRAGFTKTIELSPMMWAGDQHVDFSLEYGLPSAIVSLLSLSTSGIGQSHSDIGGYTTILHMKRSKELWQRWAEMNIFSPLYRSHEGNQPDKNVQFDHDQDTLSHFARMTSYYKHLSLYLSDLKSIYQKEGIPICRPLFYHFHDEIVYDINYEYMYGSDVLVAPVYQEGIKKHSVYLPNANWIQMFTNLSFNGGYHEIDAPIGRPIAFYLKDSTYASLFKKLSAL